MIKLRSTGFSFGEIGLCAGVSRQAVSEKMKTIAPHLLDQEAFKENEGQYYLNEEITCLALSSLLRDRVSYDLINDSHVNVAAVNASAKLAEVALKIFGVRRLIDGKSTSNQSHFSQHYRNAELRKPHFTHAPITDLSQLPPHTIDVRATRQPDTVPAPPALDACAPPLHEPTSRPRPPVPPIDGTMRP